MSHKWFWAIFEQKLKFEHFSQVKSECAKMTWKKLWRTKKFLLAHWFGNVLQLILSYFWAKTKIWTFLPRWSQSAPKWHTLFHVVPTRASALGLCFLLPHRGGGKHRPRRKHRPSALARVGTIFHVHPLFSSLPAAFTSATPFHTSWPIQPSPGPRGSKASLRPSQHHVRTATA